MIKRRGWKSFNRQRRDVDEGGFFKSSQARLLFALNALCIKQMEAAQAPSKAEMATSLDLFNSDRPV
jgi:hypothetical protein